MEIVKEQGHIWLIATRKKAFIIWVQTHIQAILIKGKSKF